MKKLKYTPKPGIVYAAECGDTRDLQAHLRAGVDPDTIWYTGITPLMAAAFEGHLAACRVLLEAGASLDLYDSEVGWSAVHDAVRGGNPRILDLFVSFGADVLQHERRGGSLLSLAAGSPRHSETLTKGLLKTGCDPNMLHNGATPLHRTPPAGNLGAAEVLVAHGADPTVPADEGYTVWDCVLLNYQGKELERWRRALRL